MPTMTTILNTFQGIYGWSTGNWSFRLFRILMDYGSFRIIWTHCVTSHGWRSTAWIPKGFLILNWNCFDFLVVLPLDGIWSEISILMNRHFSRCCSYDKPEFSTDFSICLCYLKSCKVFFVRVRETSCFRFYERFWHLILHSYSTNVSIWHLKIFNKILIEFKFNLWLLQLMKKAFFLVFNFWFENLWRGNDPAGIRENSLKGEIEGRMW